jgi:acyl phosphate:glycerol-3-phosphate acyltransferase
MPALSTLTVFTTLIAYLIGSVSFAVVVSRFMGLSDPRSYGSKNPGATNVLRTGHKKAAILTLLGDALKGSVAVLLAQALNHGALTEWGIPISAQPQLLIALAAIAVFLGHLFPVFHGFTGGKGVATALGILLAVNLGLGFGVFLTWLLIAFAFRYSSLSALVAALLAPLYQLVLFGYSPVTLAIMAMSGLLIYRHRRNIANLLAGTETKIGSKKNKS